MTLTAAEVERGWVEFACDAHGFLVATTPNATVWCFCGKRARHTRHGRLLDPDTLKPTQAKAREVNTAGHPFIHSCGDCGQDFHGRTLQQRHRVGSKLHKRCMTPEEMIQKGWHQDTQGRWRRAAPTESDRERLYEKSPRPAPRERASTRGKARPSPKSSDTQRGRFDPHSSRLVEEAA
jgi:hypothetical protein